ncbi:MAG TPA: tripartite tricarboxylate transporter substrate binding protein [Casimicrobiaceae bacterium]|nr:tripartite tricarboxylate transporter substrate binding protein [Casimicrobiaceae bacterium]
MIRSFIFAVCAFVGGQAHAQAWPVKPVRIVVAFAPGGSLDFATRTISERLAADLGQPIVVENRAGANGNVGAEYVAKQPADGYTVLASADALVSSAHLYKLGYDPMKDLLPVVQLTRQPLVLAVHPSLGVGTLQELIALAKKKPGLGYATSGSGSGQHMAGEWLAKLTGIELTHVPYKGGGQAITDLVGGQVPIGSLGSTPVMPHHKAGKLKIIAQSTAKRSPSLPDVPSYIESGVALELDQWLGFFVVTGTPPEVVSRLNAAVAKILQQPAVRELFAPQGLEAVGGSTEQFMKLYRDDYDKYGRLVKELRIKLE